MDDFQRKNSALRLNITEATTTTIAMMAKESEKWSIELVLSGYGHVHIT